MGRRLKGEPPCLVLCLRRTGVWTERRVAEGVLGLDLMVEERLRGLAVGRTFFVRPAFLGVVVAGL